MNQKKLDELDECRLLGVILTNDLSFEKNSEKIVKNAYCRMIMLRKLSEFCVPIEDMLNIYILYIRSAAEQSCVVWRLLAPGERQIEPTLHICEKVYNNPSHFNNHHSTS